MMEGLYNTRNPAVKRIFREAQELAQNPDEDFHAGPLQDNLFEWHFTVKGPTETPFENGLYHGRIILPADYPMKPPNIIILTPNGRFETDTKICLSISGYHPETWQPSWSIRTALKALIGFMPTPGNGAIGALDQPDSQRKQLAQASRNWTCPQCKVTNCDLISSVSFASASGPEPNTSSTPNSIKPEPPIARIEIPAIILPKPEVNSSATPTSTESVSGSPSPFLRSDSLSLQGSGDAGADNSPQARPRVSSLSSRPGRGIGKRAHFADELPTPPNLSPAITAGEPYSFPPKPAPTALSNIVPQPSTSTAAPPLSSNENSQTMEDINAMRERQRVILQERRRILRQRLENYERSHSLPEEENAGQSLGRNDLARLEKIIGMVRQILLFLMVCLIIIVLRRVVSTIDEDELDFSEL